MTSRWSRTASTSCFPIEWTGFSDVIGSWKIIAMSLPRISRSARALIVSRSSPLKSASPARDRVPLRVQAHDRQAGDALAAAGLADDAERLALLDREADAVDRLDDAVVGAEVVRRSLTSRSATALRSSLIRGSIQA